MTSSRWYDRLAALAVSVFALKPVIDLEYLSGAEGLHLLGQRFNPAAVVGVLFLGLPILPLLKGPLSFRMKKIYALFIVLVGFMAAKVAGGFSDPGLFLRFGSSFSVCLFLCSWLESERLTRRDNVIFLISIAVILVLSFLQAFGVLPTLVNDYINGRDVGRITGGYGHPLSLSRVFVFVGLIALLGFHRSEISARRAHVVGWLLVFAVLASATFRSTYRTGILFFTGIPFVLLILREMRAVKRFMGFASVIAVMGIVIFLASSQQIKVATVFGHSAGFVINEAPVVDNRSIDQGIGSNDQSIGSNDQGIVANTNWEDQTHHFGRGRGEIWLGYAGAMKKSSLAEFVFGHKSTEVTAGDRNLHEPHNMGVLSLFTMGLFGTGLLVAFYGMVWIFSLMEVTGDRRWFVHAAFLVPLWFSLVAEPLRYPTFFTMLFMTVAIVRQWPSRPPAASVAC